MSIIRPSLTSLVLLAALGIASCSSATDQAAGEEAAPTTQESNTGESSAETTPTSSAQAPRTGKTDVGIVVDDADGTVELDLSSAIFVNTSGEAPGVRAQATCDGSSYGIVAEGWGLGHGITKHALGGPTAQQEIPLEMVSAHLPADVNVTEELDTIMTSEHKLGLSLLVQPSGEDTSCDVYVTDLSNGNVLVDETVVDGPYDGIAYIMYQPGLK